MLSIDKNFENHIVHLICSFVFITPIFTTSLTAALILDISSLILDNVFLILDFDRTLFSQWILFFTLSSRASSIIPSISFLDILFPANSFFLYFQLVLYEIYTLFYLH